MSVKTARKAAREYLKKNESEKEAFDKFIKDLPVSVEEVQQIRVMSGKKIIEELKEQGKHDEANLHDPNKEYKRLYTTLKKINHEENCKKIFQKKGVQGLVAYRNNIIKTNHYLRGKYPKLFKEEKPNFFTLITQKINDFFNQKKGTRTN